VGKTEDRTFGMPAHRNSLPPLRRPSRSCLRRWAEADRLRYLHGGFALVFHPAHLGYLTLKPALLPARQLCPVQDRGFLFIQ